MVPTVITLSIHLPNKKVIVTGAFQDPKERVDLPSALERYFGRPEGLEFDVLSYSEYYARDLVEGHSMEQPSCTRILQAPAFRGASA
jgi:hypothetical protein